MYLCFHYQFSKALTLSAVTAVREVCSDVPVLSFSLSISTWREEQGDLSLQLKYNLISRD